MSFADRWQINLKRNLPLGHRLETLNAKDMALAQTIDEQVKQLMNNIAQQMRDAAQAEVD